MSVLRWAAVTIVIAALLGCEGRHTGHDTPVDDFQPRIVFHADSTAAHFGCVALHGVPARVLERLPSTAWPRFLRVATGDTITGALPAVLGAYEVESGVLRFRPRFAFDPGMTYTAHFDGGAFDSLYAGRLPRATPTLRTTFVMPGREAPATTRVTAVYPSARQLPENLLRLYVHFSAPMRAKDIHARVHIYDEAGTEVPLAFVEVPHGLWDRTQQRLTLFLHPGRIKRGVGPNRTLGTPLRAGHRYRLVVDVEARDAAGRPLTSAYEKVFDVVEADRSSPEPRDWRLLEPTSAQSNVSLVFPEALDHALLQRWITVTDAHGNAVEGSAHTHDGERRWTFQPAHPWTHGSYALQVHPALEDLAGNTMLRLFDTETAASPTSADSTGATTAATGATAAAPDDDTERLQLHFVVRDGG